VNRVVFGIIFLLLLWMTFIGFWQAGLALGIFTVYYWEKI
jgi:hypothetical protein